MIPSVSDLGDLLELVHTSRHRYRSLRLTARLRVDATAIECAHLARRDGTPVIATEVAGGTDAGTGEPPGPDEHTARLWFAQPGRLREEHDPGAAGRGLLSVVADGTRHSRTGHGPVWRDEGRPFHEHAAGLFRELTETGPLFVAADATVTGATRVAGRPGIACTLRMRDDTDPCAVTVPRWVEEHRIVVDAATGVALRIEARTGGVPLTVTEVLEFAVDEDLPDALFRHTPAPGERVRDASSPPVPEHITLHEAVARAGFTVLAPTAVPGGAPAVVEWFPGDPDAGQHPAVNMSFQPQDGPGRWSHLWLTQVPQEHADRLPPDRPGAEEVRRGGRTYRLADTGQQLQLTVTRGGTAVFMVAQNLDRDTLVDVAESLVPVPPARPVLAPPGTSH